jgi:LPXTG-motif cell wall-anchored protein
LKKLVLLAAMLAMVLVAVAPAFAQIGAGAGQEEIESGGAEGAVGVTNKGDLANQCAALLNAVQTGNATAAAGIAQYLGATDDIEIAGSSIALSPELASECNQTISVKGKEEKKPEVKVEVKPGAPKVEVKAEAPKVEVKALPKTGGEASLLALGAGALLVAGGLLVRRIIR